MRITKERILISTFYPIVLETRTITCLSTYHKRKVVKLN